VGIGWIALLRLISRTLPSKLAWRAINARLSVTSLDWQPTFLGLDAASHLKYEAG